MPDENQKSFKKFSETATIHGLYQIAHSEGVLRKVVWAAIFLVIFVMFLVTVTLTFVDFFKNNSYTALESKTQGPMEFPSVTICHANNFKLSAFGNLKIQLRALLKSTKERSLGVNSIFSATHSDVFATLMTRTLTNSSIIKQMSSTPNALRWNFVDWCTFSYSSQCRYPDDFKDFFYHSLSGFCKTLDFKGKRKQVAPGLLFGLNLKLFIDQRDKVPLASDNGGGVILAVHPRDVYPNPYAKGILLPTGSESFISLKKLVFKRLKKPYKSNCTDGKGHFQIYPGKYNVINCQYSCHVRNMMEECGYIEQAYKYHKPKEFAESLRRVKKLPSNQAQVEECMNKIFSTNCDCPTPCDEEKLMTSVSSTQWPNPASMDYYKSLIANFTKRKNITDSEVSQSILSVKVFFDELGYDVVSERPTNKWPQLLSNIGGQMGLWIGASVFSIFEVIMFLLRLCARSIKRKVGPENNKCQVIEVQTIERKASPQNNECQIIEVQTIKRKASPENDDCQIIEVQKDIEEAAVI